MKKVLVLIGGISKDSVNKQLFSNVKELAGDEFEFDVLDIVELPCYSQDFEDDMPQVVKNMKARAEACDGLLFITPEYNRSIPGVLKNAIDLGSRPSGYNCWAGKPAAIIGAAVGTAGTYGAQSHLRDILTELSVCLMPTPHFYYTFVGDMQDGRVSAKTAGRLQKLLENFALWIGKFK